MAMNYSYKPLLILSLLDSDRFSAPIDEITGFYLSYYRKRAQKGQIIEKEDSAFVRNADNFKVVKRTILTYPVSVLAKKAFIIYEKETGTVRLNEMLIAYVGANREEIRQQCYTELGFPSYCMSPSFWQAAWRAQRKWVSCQRACTRSTVDPCSLEKRLLIS